MLPPCQEGDIGDGVVGMAGIVVCGNGMLALGEAWIVTLCIGLVGMALKLAIIGGAGDGGEYAPDP